MVRAVQGLDGFMNPLPGQKRVKKRSEKKTEDLAAFAHGRWKLREKAEVGGEENPSSPAFGAVGHGHGPPEPFRFCCWARLLLKCISLRDPSQPIRQPALRSRPPLRNRAGRRIPL